MPWNYRLLDNHPLGSGPAGSFWKYEDIQTKELVAVKRIDPGTVMDVEAEVKALEAIKAKPHPRIVELICATAEEVEGVRYNFIVFKYLPGGSLLHLMGRLKTLHIDFAKSIARRVVSACYSQGLDHLHNELGLTHGDLKPENILFKDREMTQIVIADHRLALAANMNEELKKTFIAGGTTEYLAYEVWKRSELGKPMDLWALGVVTYVMLTYGFPFKFNLAKQMKETMAPKLKSTDVGDLMNVTQNPLMEATQEASANARETIEKTIEKGVDWTLFPINEEYAQARDFIQGLINLNDKERLTTKQALDHEFMKPVNVRPASVYPDAAAGASRPLPMSPPASRPASIRSVRSNISQKSRASSGSRYSDVGSRRGDPIDRTEKLMHSEYTGKKLDQISLRSVSSLGNSFIGLEDLSFWERHDRLLSMTNAQIKTLLVLSVRAGFTIVDGKMKLVVPNIRGLETLLRHIYHAQKGEFYARPSRQNSLTPIREESGSEGGSRATSPAPRHRQREEPANERQVSKHPSRASSRASVDRNKRRSRPPSILEVVASPSRPPSVGEQAKATPPASPSAPLAGTTGTEQQKEPERAPSPAPSKRSIHSDGGKTRSKNGSRHSSRQPSPAPKKDSGQTRTGPPSRAPTPALSTKSRTSTKEKSKEIQPGSEAKIVEGAPPAPTEIVEGAPPAPTETEPSPPSAPPAGEPASTPTPGDSKETKSHSRPSSIRSVKSTHSRTSNAPSVRSVFSTASYKNKAKKLAQVPKRPSSTPPTSSGMVPPPPATPPTPAPPPVESSGVKEEVRPSSPVIVHSNISETKEKTSPKVTSRPASRAASTTPAFRKKASKSGSEEEKKHKEHKEHKEHKGQKKEPADAGRSDAIAKDTGTTSAAQTEQPQTNQRSNSRHGSRAPSVVSDRSGASWKKKR
ncbi:CMK1_2 [Sanghuangporus weigelae]